MDKNFLTVAEFAEKVGLTQQAIYRRLTLDLKEFVIKKNGKLYLQEDSLKLFKTALKFENNLTNFQVTLKQDFKSIESELENESSEPLLEPDSSFKAFENKELKFQVELEKLKVAQLEKEIQNKEEVIKDFKQQIAQKDKQIQDLTDMLEDITRTLSQQQELQLQQQRLLEPILGQKKSFWQRIFNK